MADIRRTGIIHDIVRGGQAKYQGTYLDMESALELCQQHGVDELRMHLQDAWERARPQTVSVGDEATTTRRQVNLAIPGASDAGLETYEGEPHVITAEAMRAETSRFIDSTSDGISGANSKNQREIEADQVSYYTQPSYSNGSFLLPFKSSALEEVHPRPFSNPPSLRFPSSSFDSDSMNPRLCSHTSWCGCRYASE